MPDLTFTQRFGSNAFLENSDDGLILSITLSDLKDASNGGDFTNGLGLDTSNITEENIDEYASKILWALIGLSQQNQPESNTDETVAIYISSQGKRNVTRNDVAQFGYLTVVTGYENDNSGLVLDPDNLGFNTSSTEF